MSNLIRYIGINGAAESGKDLFYKLIKKHSETHNEYDVVRFALADELKSELRSFILKHFHLDINSCTSEEKNLVRPLLVAYGKIKREQSKGRFWIEKVDKSIKKFAKTVTKPTIVCITDVRYHVFEKDEVDWVLNELNGKLLVVKKFTIDFSDNNSPNFGKKVFKSGANEDEIDNNQRIETIASHILEWSDVFKNGEDPFTSEKLMSKAVQALEFLK